MRKYHVLLTILLISQIYSKAQLVSVTFEGSYVYIPQNPVEFKKPVLMKLGVENWFLNRFAIGVNVQLGGAELDDWDYISVTDDRDLEVTNFAESVNAYAKFAIFSGDDYSFSIKPEIGYGLVESRSIIYFHDHLTKTVTSTRYKTVTQKMVHFGLGVQGQYFISESWDICLSLSFDNYDLGKSLNKIDLKGQWSHGFDEKTIFLSAGIGFHYYIFGKSKR